MTNIEIERKYLVVDDSYKALAVSHYSIVQGYICRESGRTVRVRMRTSSDGTTNAYLTIKGKAQEGTLSRYEWEREIDMNDAKELLQLCQGNIIDKTRWIVPAKEDGLIWEIDQFHSTKKGLTLAEIELTAENQSFELPPFIGEEVTGQAQYYNSNM
jgi:CYTH domain-containing protein